MAKFNEIIYDVREAVKQYSDDSELDDRYIKYLYNNKRSKYLRQDLNNYSKVMFKIYLISDENTLKKKIRLQML